MTCELSTEYSTDIAAGASTLVELLRLNAAYEPGRVAYTYLADGEAEEVELTCGELDRKARAIGALLQAANARGERVLLLYPSGLDYIAAFFGCLYAGAIAVPAYPPRLNQNLARIQGILADSEATITLTLSSIAGRIRSILSQSGSGRRVRWFETDRIDARLSEIWREPRLASGSIAFLQYTSGSTSAPKGVVVTHGNLLHNERLIQNAFQQTRESVIVGWLPLYHDMGLIGNVIQALYVGARCILMSPLAFLQRPFRWLQAISRYKATTSGGPNFAYDLCVRKIRPEQKELLDLSTWTVAFNGSEPVREETLSRFAEAFEPCGFRAESFRPCYGLAEATLMVAGRPTASRVRILRAHTAALGNNRIVAASEADDGVQSLIGCGEIPSDQKVLIVNPESRGRCASSEIGEIWISGPSKAHGYWRRHEINERVFGARLSETDEGPFLRTGDLGVIEDGALFITGRLKDLIIIRGLNYYPQDIERTAEQSDSALRPGCCAAFSAEIDGEERLVLVAEADGDVAQLDRIASAIRRRIAERHELHPFAVVLIKRGGLPKTSSGKIQRYACREKFLSGSLQALLEWREAVEAKSESGAAYFLASFLESPEQIEGWLRSRIASRLSMEPSEIDVNVPIPRYGLDSLAAVELVHELETSLGITLTMSSLLQDIGISDLARQAFQQSSSTRVDGLGSVAAGRRQRTCALSRGQQALWFLYNLNPQSSAYNISNAIRIWGPLDLTALRTAFQSLVSRHEGLRANFEASESGPLQRIADNIDPLFEEETLSDSAELLIEHYLVEEAHRPFDLQQGPPMRVKLFRVSAIEHVLLLTIHHIVSDLWSLAVLLNELTAFYEAAKSGRIAQVDPMAWSYADYVAWQEEMLRSAEGEELRLYWEKQLSGESPRLDLPADRPRNSIQAFRGASRILRLDEGLSQSLKTLSRARGVTLYVALLAAVEILLQRYSGQEEFLVGSPSTGRTRPELAPIVGYFVNTLVMRADLSGAPSFNDHLKRVRRTALEAFDHEAYPFALLVERLRPMRDPSRSPFIDVTFALQQAPSQVQRLSGGFALGESGSRMTVGDLEFESVGLEHRIAQFDLSLMAAEIGEELAVSFQYDCDLFDRATIARMTGHFQTLLEAIIADPDRAICDFTMLNETERYQMLVDWNGAHAEYDLSKCIHELFEIQAETTPDRVAVIYENENLSYAGLHARANKIARYLINKGIGTEMLVGVCMERGIDLPAALLGILKSGAAYVPVDPTYPSERLRYLLEDSGVAAVLTEQSLQSRLPEHQAQTICVDAEWDAIDLEPDTRPLFAAMADTLVYVIYTSGSTGKPKGAMATHRGVLNCIRWMQDTYRLTEDDRFIFKTSLNFDPSVWEIFWTLSTGAAVVIVPPGRHLDAAYLVDAINAQQVTTSYFVPAMLGPFLEELKAGDCASLRQVICGGETLPVETMKQFFKNLRSELHHSYGPTETSIAATEWSCERDWQRRNVTIGRPLANVNTYVLDSELQPVPIGVQGELYVGGVGVGRAYLKRPELTAEKFIPDPHSADSGARLYRTGDAVRWDVDANLEFLGRNDSQLKIRGLRIEPGEIEAVLLQHPEVRKAFVTAREYGAGEKRLAAYVATNAEASALERQLRDLLKANLPPYMVPASIVLLEELPLTVGGKIDRKALEAIDLVLSPTNEHRAPATSTEAAVAEIWRRLIGIESIGPEDNFFEIGGHSLLATRAISRIREQLGTELPLRAIFEHPTLSELAREVDAARAAGSRAVKQIQPVPRVGDIELSFGQQRLWFLDQLAPGNSFYNVGGGIRVTGELNIDALARSIREVARRHESLRTRFPEKNGQPIQKIDSDVRFKLKVEELQRPGDFDTAIARIAADEVRRPFNLAEGPLIRATLLKFRPSEHVLLITMHHIICDGWSLGVFVKELGTLYDSFCDGRPAALESLPIQYADYSEWQRHWLQDERFAEQVEYWKRRLAEPSPLDLPLDRPRPVLQSYRGATERFSIDSETTASIDALSVRLDATTFMTLLAVFKVLLMRYSGQSDLLLGSPIAGRTSGEIEPLIGFFANTLVLRTDLSGEPDFEKLVRRVKETGLGAYANQDVPFEMLIELLRPERDLSRTPLFQVMFVFQEPFISRLKLKGLELDELEADTSTAKFDLTLYLTPTSNQIKAALEYNTDLFDAGTIRRMADNFKVLLSEIAVHSNKSIATLNVLSPCERRQVLIDWNRTDIEYQPVATIQEFFEQQVNINPDSAAVVCNLDRLTYSELNRRANQLAGYLIERGVGPEVRAGVCLSRGTAMMVALLGVLKAGGAYVPLDPAYPVERVGYMLEDSGAEVVISDQRSVEVIEGRARSLILIDSDWDLISANSVDNPPPSAVSRNIAYVIYTSGSTGRPKGVAIEHRSAVKFLQWASDEFGCGKRTVLAATSICFDLSVYEIFWPLSIGGKIVIVENALEWHGLEQKEEVDLINTVPSAVTELIRMGASPGNVRVVNVAGEPLTRRLVNDLYGKWGLDRVYNLYGPTEDTTYSTYDLVADELDAPVMIGRPISNTRTYVVSPRLQPAPIGVFGEVMIAGDGLARGYIGKGDATAEKFVPDSLSGREGERLYRTGDVCRYIDGGKLEYAGRRDGQVKVRGFRIELGEVEEELRKNDEVREAVVIARGEGSEKRLIAYIVVEAGHQANEKEIKRKIRESLPDYMIPAVIETIEKMPLTANGKTDRKALAALEETYTRQGEIEEDIKGELEELIAGIWEEVLGVKVRSTSDNFFELGGHSLLATRVMSRIREAVEIELPLRELFQEPTVAGFARKIEAAREKQGSSAGLPSSMKMPRISAVSRRSQQIMVSTDGSLVVSD